MDDGGYLLLARELPSAGDYVSLEYQLGSGLTKTLIKRGQSCSLEDLLNFGGLLWAVKVQK